MGGLEKWELFNAAFATKEKHQWSHILACSGTVKLL